VASVNEHKVKFTGIRTIRERHFRRSQIESERIGIDPVLGAVCLYSRCLAGIGDDSQMITSPSSKEDG
jgi:hypothetical protein